MWVLREIQLLEGIHDARRAAGYLCQFTRTDYKRPLGVFSTSRKLRARLSLGWPRLERIHDRLVYKGPLPKNCACNHIHTPMIGTSADDVFCTSDTHTFSVDFWKQFVSDHPLDSELSSLRDEGLQTDFAPLHSVGLSPLLSPSLRFRYWPLFVTCTKHGKLETSPEPLYGTYPVLSLAILISLLRLRIPWLRLRDRVWPLSGRSPWFLLRRSFRMCLLACRLTLLPRLLLSGYGTRDQGLQQV